MILRMKTHVSTFSGLMDEARYIIKDSGLSSLLKTVLFPDMIVRQVTNIKLLVPMSNSQYVTLDL